MKKVRTSTAILDRRTVLKLGTAATLAGVTAVGFSRESHSAARKQVRNEHLSAPQSTLIRNVFAITMDDALGDLEGADILIKDGKIADIGRNLTASAEEIIDGSGQIVVPGFVDGHRHLWQTPMRGTGTGWGFNEYIKEMLYRRAVCYEPADMYDAALAGGLEALNAGVTSVVDHCHNIRTPAHADAAIEGMLASGVGGIFGFCYGRTPEYGPGASVSSEQVRMMLLDAPQWRFDYAESLKEKYFGGPSSRVRLGIGTSCFETFAAARPEKATQEVRRARELGADLIMQHVRNRGDFRVVKFLNDQGLLGPDMMLSHADWVTETEFQMLAEHGTNIVVTPESELKGGNSPALGRASVAGLSVGLGMDTVIMVGGDMFGPMRWVMQFQRFERFAPAAAAANRRPPDINDRDVLRAATIEGAKAVGIDGRVGSLTPGKQADIVLFRTDSLTMQPVNEPVASVVHYAHTSDIDSVWVAGKPVKRNGRLVRHDVSTVLSKLVLSRDRILKKTATVLIDGVVDLYSPQDDTASPE